MATGFALESAWARRRNKRQGYYRQLIKADTAGTAELVWETFYFGAAPGDGNASGAALTETISIGSGAATGDASAAGLALTETISLGSGAATGDASAVGLSLTISYTITGGGAAVAVDGNASGVALALTLSFSGGSAIAVVNGNAPGLAAGWVHTIQGGYAIGRPQLQRGLDVSVLPPRDVDTGGRVPPFVRSATTITARAIDTETPLPSREVEIA